MVTPRMPSAVFGSKCHRTRIAARAQFTLRPTEDAELAPRGSPHRIPTQPVLPVDPWRPPSLARSSFRSLRSSSFENVAPSIAFYRERLGFELDFITPEDGPFFAILSRDGVRLFIKAILPEVGPLANPERHEWALWDACVHTRDPETLAAEFAQRGAGLQAPLADTSDGLRGFEVKDPDGYVLFFGRSM